MENIVESILMAFAVLVLVIALSMTTYLLSTAMSTTEQLVYGSDKTQYLSNINNNADDYLPTRIVGIDTVINSLYRYYKQNFMVRIFDSDGNLHQIFDTTIEGKVYVAASKPSLDPLIPEHRESIALLNMYGASGTNLFGAPWMGNIDNFAKQRVDLYISGQTGYVNNGKVDYGNISLEKFRDLTNINSFEETFIEYQYSGQTISVEGGIESITGNEQAKNKIIIEYRAKKNISDL